MILPRLSDEIPGGRAFNKNYCSNVDIFEKFLKVFS